MGGTGRPPRWCQPHCPTDTLTQQHGYRHARTLHTGAHASCTSVHRHPVLVRTPARMCTRIQRHLARCVHTPVPAHAHPACMCAHRLHVCVDAHAACRCTPIAHTCARTPQEDSHVPHTWCEPGKAGLRAPRWGWREGCVCVCVRARARARVCARMCVHAEVCVHDCTNVCMHGGAVH